MDSRERKALADQLQRGLVDGMIIKGAIRTDAVRQAFLEVPRHLFVDRYYEGDRLAEVAPDGPTEEQLRRIYSDDALVTCREDATPASSTSQPGLVAQMLEQLRLEPGMSVLEVGAGTGWNAGLMGHIVGPEGHVLSMDIQGEVAEAARSHLDCAGVRNVRVITGDGGYGHAGAAPYDRIVTTANCHDISPHWADQLARGGGLLVTLRDIAGSRTCLTLRLWRRQECLSGEVVSVCGFITLRGDFGTPEVTEPEVEQRRGQLAAGRKPRREPAPWCRLGLPEESVRSLLADLVFFAHLEGLAAQQLGAQYGLVEPRTGDACVTDGDTVDVYGGEAACRRLGEILRRWIALGAPRRWSYTVEAWPLGVRKRVPRHGWLLHRPHTQLVLRLKQRGRDSSPPW
jgi:protein-L-isoaspartate(D-aspartate) O-methyltransferase